MVRTRFAPSPTGYLHIGGARTALFSYLFAKHHGGEFILRIEDTDLARSTNEFSDAILDQMKWLGLNWNEGPDCGGKFGPYRQSDRLDIYDKYLNVLKEKGIAYSSTKKTDENDFNIKGEPAWYFRVSGNEKIEFKDAVHGDMNFDAKLIEDFVLVRSNGMPTYNFACVVDDALMQISHVIRGDDHLSNTPRQVLIYQALGFELPVFAHVPMILGNDGERLSKRHGAVSIGSFKNDGLLPQSMLNYLGLLSWSIDGNTTMMTVDDMIKHFEISNVNKSSAMFDYNKLDWMNGVYLRELSISDLGKIIANKYPNMNFENVIKISEVIKPKINSIKDIDFDFLFIAPNVPDKIKSYNYRDMIFGYFLDFKDLPIDFQTYKAKCKELGISIKDFTMVIRMIVCGTDKTILELFTAMNIIGKIEIERRLKMIFHSVE